MILRFLVILFLFVNANIVNAQGVTVSGSYKHNSAPGTWSRGMASTMYCGNSPESWVRGNATLDPSSGVLSITVQLETDSAKAGPKGKISVTLKGDNDKVLGTATTEEIGTGGKDRGNAVSRNFSGQARIDPTVARTVRSMYLDAQCTGSIDRILNINLNSVEDAIKIIVAISSL